MGSFKTSEGECGHIKSGSYCKICGTKPEKKKRSRINPVSDKLKTELKVYADLRKIFLAKNVLCDFEGCTKHSFDVHHKKGRGKNLNNVETWMAVCRDHHIEIENHPELAKEKGYSESRLQV